MEKEYYDVKSHERENLIDRLAEYSPPFLLGLRQCGTGHFQYEQACLQVGGDINPDEWHDIINDAVEESSLRREENGWGF